MSASLRANVSHIYFMGKKKETSKAETVFFL